MIQAADMAGLKIRKQHQDCVHGSKNPKFGERPFERGGVAEVGKEGSDLHDNVSAVTRSYTSNLTDLRFYRIVQLQVIADAPEPVGQRTDRHCGAAYA